MRPWEENRKSCRYAACRSGNSLPVQSRKVTPRCPPGAIVYVITLGNFKIQVDSGRPNSAFGRVSTACPVTPHHKHPYPQSQTSGHPAKENSAHNGSNRREAKVSYFTLSGLAGEPTFTVGRLES